MSGSQIPLKDQNGIPILDSLKDTVKKQLEKILSDESVQATISQHAEKLRIEMVNNLDSQNKELDTITMGTNSTPIAQKSSLSMAEVQKKPQMTSSRISEEINKTMIKQIPSEISSYLIQYLNETSCSIINLISDPDEFLSSITEEKINEILKNIKIPYLTFSLQDVKITTKDKNQLKCNFNFETNSLHPFIKILSEPPIIMNPLFKMVFKIYIDGTISDIQVDHKKQGFIVNLGNLDANFSVIIKEVKVINRTIISSDENEENPDKLIERNFTKKLPTFSINVKN